MLIYESGKYELRGTTLNTDKKNSGLRLLSILFFFLTAVIF